MTRAVSRLASSVRPVRSGVIRGRAFGNVSVASTGWRLKRCSIFATQARSGAPRTATTSDTFVPGAAIRARATAVVAYAAANFCGSSSSRLRSTTTGERPPERDLHGRDGRCRLQPADAHARDPDAGRDRRCDRRRRRRGGRRRGRRGCGRRRRCRGRRVVVTAVVVAGAVDVVVDVVTSAITVPERTPATTKPSAKRPIASRRFTPQAV